MTRASAVRSWLETAPVHGAGHGIHTPRSAKNPAAFAVSRESLQ